MTDSTALEPVHKQLMPENEADEQPLSFAKFLETFPPGREVHAQAFFVARTRPGAVKYISLRCPDIVLYCDHQKCGGPRVFRSGTSGTLSPDAWNQEFLYYKCSNCDIAIKVFAVAVKPEAPGTSGLVYKHGEFPKFGPRVPAKLVTLVGSDRELFLQGRQCEVHNLGIGAFVYYRRVVEDKKSALIDKIIQVVKTVDPGNPIISELEAAKAETRFSKAIDSIKSALPQGLLINGHNPLLLLHRPLSEGIHNKSDAECLRLATSIRVVLTELVERMNQLLKNDEELGNAIKALTGGQ